MNRQTFCIWIMILTTTCHIAVAQESNHGEAPAQLTVAILNFDTGRKDDAIGSQVSDVLAALISDQPGITLVDRAHIDQVLEEQEMSLTGLVSTDEAVKVGRIAGARIIITGKAFTLGRQMFITAKLIGVETTLVEAVLVKGSIDDDLGELVVALSEKIADTLIAEGPKLIAGDIDTADPLIALRDALADRQRPTIAVVIPERHIAERRPARIDPAVETEIKKLLIACGFTVMDVKQNELVDWANQWNSDGPQPWPRELAGADVVIVGEGFSEFLTRVGSLVSCAARAEINVIRREDGAILHADRTTTRAVDLAENTAGKTALQKAGHVLALDLLEHFAASLPAAESNTE